MAAGGGGGGGGGGGARARTARVRTRKREFTAALRVNGRRMCAWRGPTAVLTVPQSPYLLPLSPPPAPSPPSPYTSA
jgi:hypothetical protein